MNGPYCTVLIVGAVVGFAAQWRKIITGITFYGSKDAPAAHTNLVVFILVKRPKLQDTLSL
jgi:hypothetical protein